MAVTKEQILGWTGGSTNGADIYKASQMYGFKPEDVDSAFGFKPGYSAQWTTQNIPKPANNGAPGIIGTAVNAANPLQSFKGYDAERISVDADKSTVQGQLSGIMKTDSPIMTLARTGAAQTANKRGLLNSSMAAGAGEKAVIESAMPIAQQDAGTYFKAQENNQAAGNKAMEFTANAGNVGAELATRNNQETAMTNLRGTQEMQLQTLRGTQQKELDQIAATNQRLLTSSQSASLIFANNQQAVASILENAEIPIEQKQQLINQLNATLNNQLKVIATMGDLDLGDLLNFGGGTPAPAVNPASAGLNAIAAGGGDENAAIAQMYEYAVQNNMTAEQVAQARGIPVAQVQAKLQQAGLPAL